MGRRSAKIAEKLVDYGNTCVPENFIPWLINWQLFAPKVIKWLLGECADLFFDNIMTCRLIMCFHRRYSIIRCRQKNSILINKHALNREPVPLNNNGPPTLSKRLNGIVFQDCVWGAFYVSRSFQKPTSEVSSCRDWLHRLTIAALYVLPSEAHKKT